MPKNTNQLMKVEKKNGFRTHGVLHITTLVIGRTLTICTFLKCALLGH